jgi:copper transport protein
MRFSEPVEISFGAIRVYNTQGIRVDDGTAEHVANSPEAVEVPLEPGLAQGTYTVTWRVVSADGHPISEAYVFHVRAPGTRPQGIADELLAGESGSGSLPAILYGATRWLNFAGLLALAGAVFFVVAVWWQARGATQRPSSVDRRFYDRFKLIATVSWAAVLLATAAAFVLQGAVAGGHSLGDALTTSVLLEVAQTRFGRVGLLKLGLLASGAVIFVVFGRKFRPIERESVGAASAARSLPTAVSVVVAIVALGLLTTPGLAGHAGTTSPVALNLPMDTIHLAAAAMWIGGLATLLTAAFPAVKGLTQDESARALGPVVIRFSNMAVAAVAAIIVTGTLRAWLEVGAWRALISTTYGWVLLGKLGAFSLLLALGAVNNRWAKPRIQAAVAGAEPAKAPLGTLHRVVMAEMGVVAIVLVLTALLVNLPPAKVAAGVTGPFIRDVQLGRYNVEVLIDPNRVGHNEVHLTALSKSGAAAPLKDIKVLFHMPSEDIGPLVGKGRRLVKGHFVVQGHQLSLPGDWQLEIVGRIGRFAEKRATVSVLVNG